MYVGVRVRGYVQGKQHDGGDAKQKNTEMGVQTDRQHIDRVTHAWMDLFPRTKQKEKENVGDILRPSLVLSNQKVATNVNATRVQTLTGSEASRTPHPALRKRRECVVCP